MKFILMFSVLLSLNSFAQDSYSKVKFGCLASKGRNAGINYQGGTGSVDSGTGYNWVYKSTGTKALYIRMNVSKREDTLITDKNVLMVVDVANYSNDKMHEGPKRVLVYADGGAIQFPKFKGLFVGCYFKAVK